MTLVDLFAIGGWTEARLAAELDVDPSTINRLKSGCRCASLGLALQIELTTRGEVRAEELPLTREVRARLERMRARAVAA